MHELRCVVLCCARLRLSCIVSSYERASEPSEWDWASEAAVGKANGGSARLSSAEADNYSRAATRGRG